MTEAQTSRLTAKCLQIYERNKSLRPIENFLNRLTTVYTSVKRIDCIPSGDFWDEVIIPKIKKQYFHDVTIENLLESSIALYRSTPNRSQAIELIWEAVEWEYPFDSETYTDFVDRLDILLENEQNPPTESDWLYLDECLCK